MNRHIYKIIRVIASLLLLLLNLNSVALAMEQPLRIMPTAEVLKKRLSIHFKTLVERTNLINEIAEKDTSNASEIIFVTVCAVELAYYDYLELLRRQGANKTNLHHYFRRLQNHKPILFDLLFQDHIDLLIELKQTSAYYPTESSIY